MTKWEEWKNRLDPQNGDTFRVEGERLFHLAGKVPSPLWIVELGTFKGYSCLCMASGSLGRPDACVACVDAWGLDVISFTIETMGIFLQNTFVAGLQQRVLPLRMMTTEGAKIWPAGWGIGLLHIDAAHDYASVCGDVRAWVGHLASGATVTFHDYNREKRFDGVTQLVDELRGQPQWTDFRVTNFLAELTYRP